MKKLLFILPLLLLTACEFGSWKLFYFPEGIEFTSVEELKNETVGRFTSSEECVGEGKKLLADNPKGEFQCAERCKPERIKDGIYKGFRSCDEVISSAFLDE